MQKYHITNRKRNRYFGLFTVMILLISIFAIVIPSTTLFAQPEGPKPFQPNIFDEYFTYATVIPFDTDNDDLNDAARVEYDVDTEGVSEEVQVIMHVYNSSAVIIKNYSETFRVVHEIEITTRYFEFYAQYTDNYNFSLELYDLTHDEKENNGLNEEALPSPVLLQVNISEYQIFVDTNPLDEDNNGYYDDVIIKVTDSLNYTLEGVEIYVDGYFSGYTDVNGLYYYYNLSRGIHEIDALYGGYHDNEEFRSEGIGINQPLYADADPYDQDADGYDDDVIIYSLGPNYVAVPGALVYIDWMLVGFTNLNGMFYGYDFEIGFHYVMITFQDYTAYSAFYAEGSNVTDMDEYFFYIWGEARDLDGGGVMNDVDIYIDVDVSEGGTSHVYVYATVYFQNRTIAAKGDVNYTTTGWEVEDKHIYIYNLSYDVYNIRYELYDDNDNLEDVVIQYDLVIMSSFGIINVDRMIYNFEGQLMNDVIYYAHIKDLAIENVKIEIFYMSNDSYLTNVTTDEYGIAFYQDLPIDDYYWYANDSKDNMVEYGEFNIYTAPLTAQVQDYLADEDGDNFHDEFVISAYDPSGNAVHTVNYLIWDEDDNLFDSGNTLGGQAVIEDIPEGNYTFYIKFGTNPFIWLCNGSFYSYGTPSESVDALNIFITPQDYDSDGYYDDVEVLATNNNDMPVIGIVVIFDSDPLKSDTTNVQGKAQGYDFEFGWHSVDAVNPYQHQGVPAGARAHSWFFLEGFDYDEYFYSIYGITDDLNDDNEWNDINITIDADVDEDVESEITVYAYIYYQSNGSIVATANITYVIFNGYLDDQYLEIYNLPYNETYNATYLLYDSNNKKEDERYQYDIRIIPIEPVINVELYAVCFNEDNIANDIFFVPHIIDNMISNVNIKIYNKSNDILVYNLYTNVDGYIIVENVNNGDYYYLAYAPNNTFIEYGEFYIGTNINIQELLYELDNDGFYDDFLYFSLQQNSTGYYGADVDVYIYDKNDKLIDSGNTLIYWYYEILNLTEGYYKFKALNNTLRLSNGTFYSYGNGYVNQPPTPVISSPLDQSKYNTTDPIHFDGTSSTDPDKWDQLTYYWESDLDGKIGETGEFWKQLSEGTHKITLWTDDAHGHNPSTFATISVQLPVLPNDPPYANLTSPTESQQFLTTDSISFDGSTSSDPDGDPLTFYWTSNITGALAGNVSSFSKSLSKGFHQITLFVDDNNLHNVSAMVNISVVEPSVEPNDVPIVNISLPRNNTIWNATDLIIFDSIGTYDPDDDINDDAMIDPVNETDNLTYQWTSNITGELSTSPNFNTTQLSSPLETGHHQINLTVVDPLGANATASINIVIANLPPTGSITQPLEGALYYKSDEINFFSSAADPENDVLYYYWEIVDTSNPGNMFKIHNQSHSSQKLPEGEYEVHFYADDHNGPDELGRVHNISSLVNISVENRAPSAFAGADRPVNAGEIVEFNASGSSDPDGPDDEANFAYTWNFGDGSSLQGMVVQHTYANTGTYDVNLTVIDTGSATNNTDYDNLTITVNTPPVAEIWAPSVVTKDAFGEAKVHFDASNSTDIDGDTLTFIWDFDDGKTGVGMTTTHTYTLSKLYNVTLNVSDSVGFDVGTISVRVNTAPLADAGDDLTDIKVNELIQFDGTLSSDLDNDIITYSWDFGDGTTDIIESPTHRYSISTNYTVTLTVTDEWGAESTDIIDVKVLPTPPEFTSHSEDEKVLGTITLAGKTNPSAGEVEKVEIKIGSSSWQETEPRDTDDWSTWSYDWKTTDESNGNYKIIARLRNPMGLSSDAVINLTVNNKITYPTIFISSPNDGTKVENDVVIEGTTTGESITTVRVKVGSGSGKTYRTADDMSSAKDWSLWEFEWDTTRGDNGDYTIYANVTASIQGKNYYDEVTIEVTVDNPEVTEPDDEDEGAGFMDMLTGNTMVLYGVIGVIILLIIIILIAVMRKSKKKREPRPEEEMGMAPGLPPPELELMEGEKEAEAPKPPEVKKLPVKCPKCKDIFITEDDGTRPIILKCETCGARGIIRTPPEPEEEPEEEGDDNKTDESEAEEDAAQKGDDEPEEELKRKPIIKCPNCRELFPADVDAGEIECPSCGTKGSIQLNPKIQT